MSEIHIKDSVVNFYLVAEVPGRAHRPEAYFWLKARRPLTRPRESRQTEPILPFGDGFAELLARWKEDEEAEKAELKEAAGGDAP